MKNIFLLLVILIVSCNINNQIKDENSDKWRRNNWEEDFKSKVFCDCVLAGLNDKKLADEILIQDRSFASPINYVLFDSLSKEVIKPVIQQLRQDSAKSVLSVSENAAGKKIFKTCLNFYQSKKLDSIVKIQQIKWSKITNIDSLISKKVPSY